MLGLGRPKPTAPRDPHGILQDVRMLVEQRRPGAALLGEADVEPEEVVKFFGDDDELSMLFNFLLNNWLWLALAEESKGPLIRVLEQLPSPPSTGQWVHFLRNLDELNLGWLDPCDRHLVLERFSPEPDTQIYGRGTRRRLAPLLAGDRRRIELAFSLLLTLPGTPMLTYGDEIGMGDDLSRPGRDAARLLMQWSTGRNGGFSDAPVKSLVRPPHADGPWGYRAVNAEAEMADESSLLNTVRQLVGKRRLAEEFGLGSWHILETGKGAVLAHRCNWREGVVLAVHNLSSKRQACTLDLRDQQGRRLDALHGAEDRALDDGFLGVDLPPFGFQWYRVVGERLGGNMGCTNY
jgi:maltose alpha-D-glucosyltransferase/alpha-amylase